MKIYENGLYQVFKMNLGDGIRYIVSKKLCRGAIQVYADFNEAKALVDGLAK